MYRHHDKRKGLYIHLDYQEFDKLVQPVTFEVMEPSCQILMLLFLSVVLSEMCHNISRLYIGLERCDKNDKICMLIEINTCAFFLSFKLDI